MAASLCIAGNQLLASSRMSAIQRQHRSGRFFFYWCGHRCNGHIDDQSVDPHIDTARKVLGVNLRSKHLSNECEGGLEGCHVREIAIDHLS